MALAEPRSSTLDTGALVALEKIVTGKSASPIARTLLTRMRSGALPVTVPTVVIAEWWRGQQGPAARLFDSVKPEATSLRTARRVGLLLATMKRPQPTELLVVDAIVVVSAASRGDDIYTSDPADIVALRDALVAMGQLAKDAVRIFPV